MGVTIKITNNTPYTWHYSSGQNDEVNTLEGHRSLTTTWPVALPFQKYQFWFFDQLLDKGIYLRYGDHSSWDLCSSDRFDDFSIRESSDRKHFELVNESKGEVVDRCTNYGRVEEEKREREERKRRQEEEQRRKEQEEMRRQAELERMRRIEEEAKRKEKQEREERERREWERQERERREWERQEKERREWERQERERQERERQERERREWERQEKERREWERQERERQERERREWERQERERQERERQERERREWERRERLKKEEKQRKLKEERRRLAELEQIRRIQEQIDLESEAAKRTISGGKDEFQQQLELQERLLHQQHTEVVHQLLDDHAGFAEKDEHGDIQGRFEDLLSSYNIRENDKSVISLRDRMKLLQNELMLNHFNKHDIPGHFQWALDRATGYMDLSLTERLGVLEAVLKATLDADLDVEDVENTLLTGKDKYVELLLSLQVELHVSNPTLAGQVLRNALEFTSQLPKQAKLLLSLIFFNNIWTPKEIQLFLGQTHKTNVEEVTGLLHCVCTYRLSCTLALTALKYTNSPEYIQDVVSCESDKNVDIILSEMQEMRYPEHVLAQLQDILQYVEGELPKTRKVKQSIEVITNCKMQIRSLDLSNANTATLKEVLVVLCRAVKQCTTFTTSRGKKVQGYFPRLTQLASLILLLLPKTEQKTGCLLEIGTGEGKTCILAMFATIQALRGIAVDVVTSSPLLSIRDQTEWKKLYDLFGVTSSTVPPQHDGTTSFEDKDELLVDAYRKQVVYGTVCTFAADILRQEFEKKTTRGGRKFECIIVDEVDYMTLDSGVQVTFLSHQAHGLRHLEQVLASIWAIMSACRPIEIFETGELQWGTRIQHFHKAAKKSIIGFESSVSENDILLLGLKLGLFSHEDLEEMKMAMTQTQEEKENAEEAQWKAVEKVMSNIGPGELFELLQELESAVGHGLVVECYSLVNNKAKLYREQHSNRDADVKMLLLQNGCACEILSEKTLIDLTVDKLKSSIKYSNNCSLDSIKETDISVVIPSFLREYVENQLPIFAENALRAIQMIPGREYMIEKASEADRPGLVNADSHHYDAIIPVDFQASGVLEKNKRWGEGLQQFLEIKHRLAISELSNVTNYMSNVHFFKKYLAGKGIYGVSGTLGGEAEKAFLERQYKTASYIIPAHRCKKLVELPAIQVNGGKGQWIQVICETAWSAANRGQVVLVICEDVKTAEELRSKIQHQATQITMYTISAKHNIEKQTFRKGNIIIATNLGGRGTDIHVHEEVNACGGLFVLLTYFPGSQRVEKQVFGRTARKGNPGMAQMVLNKDHLAAAYQGHSVETMRKVREEYELSRLEGMEKNELFQIEMKELLFSTFCEFLCDFDKNYTVEERRDITRLKIKDIPECFKIHRQKFDYETAINALKESWALWLTFHEEQISRQDDIKLLRENLVKDLKENAEQFLKGKSKNFYDYIKLAKSRTILHRSKKNESDFGALKYWRCAEQCDPFYSAVALYNQAYITINLRRRQYMREAQQLLKRANTALEVYLSELANTMMFCNLAVTKDFAPHHKDCNLPTQMTTRMNVFKSWKGHIEGALSTLEQIEKADGDAILEDTSIYGLSKNKDPITTKELMILHEFGLCVLYEVKKKPEFSTDAFLCFCLGVIQVAAGVLVCALSYGSASQFGLSLISEGVSDMIHGIKGMLQGGFDWAEWAISKAISISVSLFFGGLSKISKAVGAAKSGAKGLISGAKCSSVLTFKQCFKQAAKYTVQELGKQGCVTVLSHVANAGLTSFFEMVLRKAFKHKVFSIVSANDHVNSALTNFVCSAIPKTVIEQELDDFQIDEGCENEMRQSVLMITHDVIPGLMMDCTAFHKMVDSLSELFQSVSHHIEDQKNLKTIKLTLESAKYITFCVQMLNSFPTDDAINKNFVPKLLQNMQKLPHQKHDNPPYDVKRLKDEFLNVIARSVSSCFVQACSQHMTAIMTRTCMTKINTAAGNAVGNFLGRGGTQGFFDNQVYKHHMKKAFQKPNPSENCDEKDLDCYIEEICDIDRPATGLDLHVLTQSHKLEGRGVQLIVVDEHGNKLSEDFYPGRDSSSEDIVLRLVKDRETPKEKGLHGELVKRLTGKQSSYTGHFEILKNGSVIPVHSEGQNCLYHSIVQAMSKDSADLTQKAANLRMEVRNTLLTNKAQYSAALTLQKGYEETYKSPGKFTIIGGGKKTQQESRKRFKERLNTTELQDLPKGDVSVIKTYNLGLVGRLDDVRGVRYQNGSKADNNISSPVNADHIPPRNTFQRAHETLQRPENEGLKKKLKSENPKLYEMIDGKGNRGLCKEVLAEHHRQALTTGNSKEAHKVREKLTEVLLSGDSEKLIKLSMIVANPEMSESLKKDAGIRQRNQGSDIMSKQAVRRYHDIGDKILLEKYWEMGVIDQKSKNALHQWRNDHLYSRNSPEYHELLKELRKRQ